MKRNPFELMRLHVEALYTFDNRERLLAVNDWAGGPAPRFFLGRTSAGNLWRFRADLPDIVVAELEAYCQAEPVVEDPTRVPRIRRRISNCSKIMPRLRRSGQVRPIGCRRHRLRQRSRALRLIRRPLIFCAAVSRIGFPTCPTNSRFMLPWPMTTRWRSVPACGLPRRHMPPGSRRCRPIAAAVMR